MSLPHLFREGLASNFHHTFERWAKYNLSALDRRRRANPPNTVESQAQLARNIEADPAHVTHWRKRTQRIPELRVQPLMDELIRNESVHQFGYREVPDINRGPHPHPFFCVGMQYVVNRLNHWPEQLRNQVLGGNDWPRICDFDAACMYILALESKSNSSWLKQIRTAKPRQESRRLARNALNKAIKFADNYLLGDLDAGPPPTQQQESFYPLTREHPRYFRQDNQSCRLGEEVLGEDDAWCMLAGLLEQWGDVYRVVLAQLVLEPAREN